MFLLGGQPEFPARKLCNPISSSFRRAIVFTISRSLRKTIGVTSFYFSPVPVVTRICCSFANFCFSPFADCYLSLWTAWNLHYEEFRATMRFICWITSTNTDRKRLALVSWISVPLLFIYRMFPASQFLYRFHSLHNYSNLLQFREFLQIIFSCFFLG